jgi:benzoyl-CoA 2,3-dioxygenase component A
METAESAVIKQHLIDPEICIRCNTCEDTCPQHAITHDNNYVVDVAKCNACLECIPLCPTGAIDHWRMVPSSQAYSIETQLAWTSLPVELIASDGASASTPEAESSTKAAAISLVAPGAFKATQYGSTIPPWSAAHPYTNLYGPSNPITATVTGNVRITEVGRDYDTHLVVLDFGKTPFPLLEGQSIGVIPPGTDSSGRPHRVRQYSISSPRDGERSGFNNVSLTIKRVCEDRQGNLVRGVASNYICDLQVGDKMQVIGPFGASFLMPNHPRSHIVMICTGTGSAPMRAMILWRHRLRTAGKFEGGKLMLFFGARTKEELPYFGRLHNLQKDFIDIELGFSRTPGQPKRYVQDAMRERAADLVSLLTEADSYFYICGLKAMEEGVVLALRDIAEGAGLRWETLGPALKRDGRLHLETY